MSEPKIKVQTQEWNKPGNLTMSLDTGTEKHPELGDLNGGVHLNMHGGHVRPYNLFEEDEAAPQEPNGQLSLYDIQRPEIGGLYGSKNGRSYVPQMLALARKHAIEKTGVAPTHSSFLFADSQRLIDKAVAKGWIAKNPDWDGYIEDQMPKEDSEAFGLKMVDKYNTRQWSGDIDGFYSTNMELTSEQTSELLDKGNSEKERLVRGSTKYPIVGRGPKPRHARPSNTVPGQEELF
jgi:hypothetical protein